MLCRLVTELELRGTRPKHPLVALQRQVRLHGLADRVCAGSREVYD